MSDMLEREPVRNVYLRSELRLAGAAGQWWAVADGNGFRAGLLGGPLTVPYIPDPTDASLLAEAMRAQTPPRMIVGPRDAALRLHQESAASRRPREIRDPQPVMVVDRQRLRDRGTAPVRRGTRADVGHLSLAAAAMHREEMGADPLATDPAAWRLRMGTLVDRGWSWLWTEGGEIVFKAELSAWTPEVAQLQGVYTQPRHRRRGVAAAALAAICAELLDEVATLTLYVNAYNHPAVRLYRRLGFDQADEFATVMY